MTGSPYRSPPAREPRRRVSLPRTIALTLLLVAGNIIVCGLASMVFFLLGMLLSVMVALFGGFLIDQGDEPLEDVTSWLLGFLMVASAGLMGSFTGLGEMALWLPAGEVTAAELPAHGLARMFTLRGAETRPELSGSHVSRSSKGGGTFIQVMPLVPAGWTPASPVPAWALCADRLTCQQTPGRPGFATRPASFPGSTGRAVEDAVKQHHLRVAPDAPVLEVGQTAGDVVRARGFIPLLVSAVFGVPWLVALVVAHWRRRRAPAEGAAEG